jgi:ketosteroid isomerase-like protein
MSHAGLTTNSEITAVDRVKAANQAYYTALSARDLAAMERIWAKSAQDVNVAPPTKPVAHVDWNAIKRNYQAYWATLDDLVVSMADPQVVLRGPVAWVYGTEQAKRTVKGGQVSCGPNFGTSIFVKEEERWLMVFHQTALIRSSK